MTRFSGLLIVVCWCCLEAGFVRASDNLMSSSLMANSGHSIGGLTTGYSASASENYQNPSTGCWDAFDDSCVPECANPWLENLTFFAGVDGSKQPQDLGVNANIGGHFSSNIGIPVWEEYGLGAQFGSALLGTGNAVRVYEIVGETNTRFQSYTTIGVYQRLENGVSWGAVYDSLYQDSYDQFRLSQWRIRGQYLLNDSNEVGVTLTLSRKDDEGDFLASRVRLDAMNQYTAFWRHYYESSAQTTVWLGWVDGHGESNAVTGYHEPTGAVPVIGADILMPLNDHWVLFGETNLVLPSDTGTVDAFVGFQWYPWGGGYKNRRNRFAPVLPVASPTQMSIDASFL